MFPQAVEFPQGEITAAEHPDASLEKQDDIKTDVEPAVEPQAQASLSRRLAARHMQMLAFGGVIGSGYFISIGAAFHNAGPAGTLICFAIVGTLSWIIMQAVAEMSTMFPISGSFLAFSSRFIDESVGFTLSWSYYLIWLTLAINEYNFLSIFMGYWNTHVPGWAWILIFNVIFLVVTTRNVRWFGEIEFWLCFCKILFITTVLLCSILIAAGAINHGPAIGFSYWRDPGAFANGFVGIVKTLPLAAEKLVGSEMFGVTAGESGNPGRDVPRAGKQVVWRILILFILGIILQGMIVPYDDPQLLTGSAPAAKAMITIAMSRVGVPAFGDVVTVFCLFMTSSALNGSIYICSRSLANIGHSGHGPKILARTNKSGVPWVSAVLTNLLCLLALLNQRSGAGELFSWLVDICGVLAFMAWAVICFCHIRFRRTLKLQGVMEDELPHRAPFQPYLSYIGLVGAIVCALLQGWSAFEKPFNIVSFLQSYVMIPVFFLLMLGFKILRHTKWVDLATADLRTGRLQFDREMLEDKTTGLKSILRKARVILVG